jgi:hypothetical protein
LPNEEERDYDTCDGSQGAWVERHHITADKIPHLPRKKSSLNGSGHESGKDKPVIRSYCFYAGTQDKTNTFLSWATQ